LLKCPKKFDGKIYLFTRQKMALLPMLRLPAAQMETASLWIFPLSGRIIVLGKTKILGSPPKMEMIKWLSKNLIKLI